ncbi:MAG: epimerase [Paracoccaceae bacterium]
MTQSVLILGASGRFGRHCATAFEEAGWETHKFDRSSGDLNNAARGMDVIVNGWNPPNTDWARDVPRLTDQVIEAAKGSGATVVIPGNVYVFGPEAPPVLDATTPHRAINPLGRIRIELEAAYRASGVQTILLRAGDFLDTTPSGNWFDKIIATRAAKGITVAPGDVDAPHAWAYLPDLARATVALVKQRAALAQFEDIPFPGYTLSLTELGALIDAVSGRSQTVKPMAWWPLTAASLVWPMGRKLREMRYLWSMPSRLDDVRFKALLPAFQPTDPLTAVRSAIAHLDIQPDQPVA